MPTIKRRIAFAAGETIGNVILGDQFEFLDGPANIKLYAACDVTAPNTGVVEVELFLSQLLAMSSAPVTSRGARGITVNTDLCVDTFGDSGHRLVVRGVNTDGANAAVLEVMIVITPL